MKLILSTLQENESLMFRILDHIEALMIPWGTIHIEQHFATLAGSTFAKSPNPVIHMPLYAPSFDLAGEEHSGRLAFTGRINYAWTMAARVTLSDTTTGRSFKKASRSTTCVWVASFKRGFHLR